MDEEDTSELNGNHTVYLYNLWKEDDVLNLLYKNFRIIKNEEVETVAQNMESLYVGRDKIPGDFSSLGTSFK
ncbi:Uncharacterised protein [Lederbergia lenta]|uniref:Uncharacterized protein n=1 Tax=Lederbergia lenta TaxID=1467 RepID=A0A2X4VNK4_LEDLE|nr:Uncharacterised protein [Lederbergia lenta]